MTFWCGPLPSAAGLQVDLNVVVIANNDGFPVVGLTVLVDVLVGLLVVVVVVLVMGGLNFALLVSIVS